ncbi:hypothetical protein Vi05172_g8413 [Venturia inaequalis]|nr:hypothetical protein Vi05172_g8413 [Venturia inaequalis]
MGATAAQQHSSAAAKRADVSMREATVELTCSQLKLVWQRGQSQGEETRLFSSILDGDEDLADSGSIRFLTD